MNIKTGFHASTQALVFANQAQASRRAASEPAYRDTFVRSNPSDAVTVGAGWLALGAGVATVGAAVLDSSVGVGVGAVVSTAAAMTSLLRSQSLLRTLSTQESLATKVAWAGLGLGIAGAVGHLAVSGEAVASGEIHPGKYGSGMAVPGSDGMDIITNPAYAHVPGNQWNWMVK